MLKIPSNLYFCAPSGCSTARLVRYVRDVEVAGSNPVIPTRKATLRVAFSFMEQHVVYIIESAATGKWYYGYTTDPKKRVEFHNEGHNASTRNRGPWKIIFNS